MMQAIWLTLLHPEYSWSVVLLRYGKNKNNVLNMKKACELSGRFEKIHVVISDIKYFGKLKLIVIFIKMFIYYLFGKRKKFCKKLIESSIGEFDYDLICISSSYSVFEGAAMNFADEIPTVMLQEGLVEYIHPKTQYDLLTRIGGILLFKMKYMNLLAHTNFYYNKYCTKYATNPERLIDKSYREVKKIFDESFVDFHDFETVLKKMYDIEELDFDLIIFSSISQSICENNDMNNLREWLNNHYNGKKILIKKHPQDTYLYKWNELDITCKYQDVPGELLIRLAKNIKLIFAFPSTLLFSVIYEQGYDYSILKYCSGMTTAYQSNFKQLIETLQIKGDTIIEL